MLCIGLQGAYQWLVTDETFDLLQLCPEVVLGKYIAVTSIDSGQLVPTEKETAAGWRSHEKIAYSPKIQRAEELSCEGWDEWHIFNEPADLGISHLYENIFEVPRGRGHLGVFVNYCFALRQRETGDLATSAAPYEYPRMCSKTRFMEFDLSSGAWSLNLSQTTVDK